MTTLSPWASQQLQAISQPLWQVLSQQILFAGEVQWLYDTRGELGRGGMGVVYSVQDKRLMRAAALKILSDEGASEAARRRFIREAQITAQLTHPNIPPVYSLGLSPQNQLFMVMKRVEGETLKDSIKAHKAASTLKRQRAELLSILVKVSEAVAYAHERRVVHRDLKPANIMVGAFGEVLLMDWGLARSLDEAEESLDWGGSGVVQSTEGLTQAGSFLGTAGYSAPEQIEGMEIDCGVDVFALGVILVEILTGQPAISGATDLNRISATLKGRFSGPRDLDPSAPKELDWLARQAMHEDSEQRPSAEDFGAALKTWLAGQELAAYPYSSWQRISRWVQGRAMILTSALLIVAAVTGLSVFFIEYQNQAREARRVRDQATQKKARLERAEALRDTARMEISKGRFEAAGAAAMKSLDQTERGPEALIGVAELLIQAQRWGAADDLLFAAQGLVSDPSELLFRRHCLAAREQLRPQHSKFSRAALTSDRDSGWRDFARGLEAHIQGALKGARESYLKAQSNLPAAPILQAYLGCVSLDLSEHKEAREQLDRALSQAPSLPMAVFTRAQLANQEADWERAKRLLDRLLPEPHQRNSAKSRDPKRTQVYKERAKTWLGFKDAASALRDLDTALSLSPLDFEALLARAERYKALKQFKRALADLNLALQTRPDAALGHWRRGQLRFAQGYFEAALSDYERALRLCAKTPQLTWQVNIDKAHALAKWQRWEEAMDCISEVIDVQPDSALAFEARGQFKFSQGRFQDAIVDLDRALKLRPQSGQAHGLRGLCHHRLKAWQPALRDYDLCLQADPKQALILRSRAYVKTQLGDTMSAIEDYRRALILNRRLPMVHYNRAQLFESLGQKQDAVRDYKSFLMLSPDHPMAVRVRQRLNALKGS